MCDARGAHTDLTTVQVRALAYAGQELSNRGKLGPTAFVVTEDALFGMARMYSGFSDEDAHNRFAYRKLKAGLDGLLGSPIRSITGNARSHPLALLEASR